MESNFWTLPEGQKRMLVAQTSERVGLPPQAVEKDWWVTMTLKALFESLGKYNTKTLRAKLRATDGGYGIRLVDNLKEHIQQ